MAQFVTPCMGVWIETCLHKEKCFFMASHPVWVCGLKLGLGVWYADGYMSHPVWVCGLKLQVENGTIDIESHTLYGCVD